MLTTLALAGCSTYSSRDPFNQVAGDVQRRLGEHLSWDAGEAEDPRVSGTIGQLLSRPLTPETAVQIALLNNRDLRSTYADLGIAQANVLQATLWKNPVAAGTVLFPIAGGGSPDYTFDIVLKVMDIIYIPLRKRVAESELEETKFEVTAKVMDVAGRAYVAFIEYLGELQRVEVLAEAVDAAKAIVESGKDLREPGNITNFDFEAQVALQVEVAAELARAQMRAIEARERVNRLLGLTGLQTQWRSANRLPTVPPREQPPLNSEQKAVEASLDLGAVRQRLITMGRKYHVVDITSLVPSLDLGGRIQRDVGEDEAGPVFAMELAVFDWGQARREAARMEILKVRDEYTALAVRVRSFARLQQAKLQSSRQTAVYYAKIGVPQSQRLIESALRQYEVMQIGIFDLLQAKEKQIQAALDYVTALTAYWRERALLMEIRNGKLPEKDNENNNGNNGNGGSGEEKTPPDAALTSKFIFLNQQ